MIESDHISDAADLETINLNNGYVYDFIDVIPPFVGAYVAGPGKPGVKNKDASKCLASANASQ